MNMIDLSKKFGINVEEDSFPIFTESVKKKKIAILSDETTNQFARPLQEKLSLAGIECHEVVVPDKEPVADEKTVEFVRQKTKSDDYLLAVGSGTLNDLAKYGGFLDGKKSGCYATAPSMDGFSSSVTPLIEKGFKITKQAQTVSDILLDYSVLTNAPKIMTGAGVGDILAKFCCLTDWKISHLLFGETYNEEASSLMYTALNGCVSSLPSILNGGKEGVRNLMNALLTSGYAMVIAGNSRPASGAEHHMSHFLEMDYLKRGKRIPLHGVKVGLGTMVSLHLYHNLPRFEFEGKDLVLEEEKKLPSVSFVKDTLLSLDCPTRFSQIGVSKETVREMFFEAWKIRDRFTVLTMYNQNGWMKDTVDELMDLYY